MPLKAKRHRWEDRAQARPDKPHTRAGAEDAEYRSGSDTEEGERRLLGT